jgi:hypothetical protein
LATVIRATEAAVDEKDAGDRDGDETSSMSLSLRSLDFTMGSSLTRAVAEEFPRRR